MKDITLHLQYSLNTRKISINTMSYDESAKREVSLEKCQ